jgi:hypothetical protein
MAAEFQLNVGAGLGPGPSEGGREVGVRLGEDGAHPGISCGKPGAVHQPAHLLMITEHSSLAPFPVIESDINRGRQHRAYRMDGQVASNLERK